MASPLVISGTAISASSGDPFGITSSAAATWSITFDDTPTANGQSGFQDYFTPASLSFRTGSFEWNATASPGSQPTISVIDRSPGEDLVNFAFDGLTNSEISLSPFNGTEAYFTIRFEGNELISSADSSSIGQMDFAATDLAFIQISDRDGNTVNFSINTFNASPVPELSSLSLLLIAALAGIAIHTKYRANKALQPTLTRCAVGLR